MGYKHSDPCLAKAADDEMLFVLRSTDKLAPVVVRLWAELARLHGCAEEKVQEALACAEAMEQWPTRKYPD